jgi:hypothetical protein
MAVVRPGVRSVQFFGGGGNIGFLMLPDSGDLIPGCGELFPDLRYGNLIGKWLIVMEILIWAGAELEDLPGIFPSNREI